ncbi:hypothetical protein FACS189481_5760 [Clostridia bacterium]|nr:hypothetical protein FACS189481_5760 [Clostridia bacterium]
MILTVASVFSMITPVSYAIGKWFRYALTDDGSLHCAWGLELSADDFDLLNPGQPRNAGVFNNKKVFDMIASKNKIRLNPGHEAVIFQVISPDGSVPSKFLVGVFARPTARDALVKSVCHREIKQLAQKGCTKWQIRLLGVSQKHREEAPIVQVTFTKDPKSVDAGHKASNAKNDSTKVGAGYEINNGLLNVNISKLVPLVRDNSGIRAICGIGKETFTRRSTLVSHARAEKWYKSEEGFWMAEGKLSALKDPAVRAEFIRRNKDVSGVSERQARIFVLTCAGDPAYHKAFLAYVGVAVSAKDSARPVTLRERRLLAHKKGHDCWKVISPHAVLPTGAGVPENIPVIHVLSFKSLENGNNPANKKQDGDMKLNWVKLADKSWAIELDMSVAEQANQEKDKPQGVYKNPQMIAKVMERNAGTADAATKQARFFEVFPEDNPSCHKTLLACVNVSDSHIDGACKATNRLGAYNYVKLQTPYPILTNFTGATESVPITHAVMNKTTKSVDNTPNAEDAPELDLKWVQLSDGSFAIALDESEDAENQEEERPKEIYKNSQAIAAVIRANPTKGHHNKQQARVLKLSRAENPYRQREHSVLLVCVPVGADAKEAASKVASSELDKLRNRAYSDWDVVGPVPRFSTKSGASESVPVIHVVFRKEPITVDDKYGIENGLIGLKRDIFFRVVLLEQQGENVRNLFGVANETFLWHNHRAIKMALLQRGDLEWARRGWSFYEWTLYTADDGAIAYAFRLLPRDVGNATIASFYGANDGIGVWRLAAWREVGAQAICFDICSGCSVRRAIPAVRRVGPDHKTWLELNLPAALSVTIPRPDQARFRWCPVAE